MYDQSFSPATLGRLLRKSDFHDFPTIYDDAVKIARIQAASDLAHADFSGVNPLTFFVKANKRIHHATSLSAELVLRKITLNLRRVTSVRHPDRQMIVSSLRHLLTEGTPFRIYRLDIKSFYESFVTNDVIATINEINSLSPQTKSLIAKIFEFFTATGGQGIPRGLSVSAVVSELMMTTFDEKIKNSTGVFFYARYVDDIVVVTHALENKTSFLRTIVKSLPHGLALNETKQKIRSASERVTPAVISSTVFSFSYLGYEFYVKEPLKNKTIPPKRQFREINVDISRNKLTRYKTKICRAFLDFARTGNYQLLSDRIQFLTSNFSLRDINTGRRKLAGIFYNYPYVSYNTGNGLEQLDKFLRDAIRGGHGRLFSQSSAILTKPQKRELLTLSFKRGHENRTFRHFHPKHINVMQECWAHE
ncbi:antiviral reverse transcriptase Drt3a [Paraburkholderia sp.]|uniref:antiviral reverse transcriptase Drt3a n=1 Tax=Paraburkholderia sp. TaxID=1926495 RepID=UPI00239E226D|nr:antiviral reverse transcriptase Drt3a [Paraburkholderia sp.]MDE1183478.1 reverse transcriptase domain-containing protein [Paraburkholderia sp.]